MDLIDVKELPQLSPVEERSKMIVINTINKAKQRMGIRQGLEELARTVSCMSTNYLNLSSIEIPIPITAADFIRKSIEQEWRLTDVFKYHLKFKGETNDEVAHYYYYEAIFSQPTADYPVPQATATLFFRIEDEQVEQNKTPLMFFRVEGEFTDHDVRVVTPTVDWILALLQKKLKFFRRIEAMNLF